MSGTPPDWVYTPRPHEIAIIGNDMLLAALPCRPVQLAHAVIEAGYDWFVPISWGDELVAAHVAERLAASPSSPMIQVSCPLVRRRLLLSGTDLEERLISTVSPAVALARYLRALQPSVPVRITYLGACPGARDPSIDLRVDPQPFLAHLKRIGVLLSQQPRLFETLVPPDRRRHLSLPGGLPAPDRLTAQVPGARTVSLQTDDIASELTDLLLRRETLLIDVAPAVGCSCTGARVSGIKARDAVQALEPPRSATAVIDHAVEIELQELTTTIFAAQRGLADPEAAPEFEDGQDVFDPEASDDEPQFEMRVAESLDSPELARIPAVEPWQEPESVQEVEPHEWPDEELAQEDVAESHEEDLVAHDAAVALDDDAPEVAETHDDVARAITTAEPTAPTVPGPTTRRPAITPPRGRPSRAFSALRSRSRTPSSALSALPMSDAAHEDAAAEATPADVARSWSAPAEHTLSDPALLDHATAEPFVADRPVADVDPVVSATAVEAPTNASESAAATVLEGPTNVSDEPEPRFRSRRRVRPAPVVQQRRHWDMIAAVILLLAIGILLVVMLS